MIGKYKKLLLLCCVVLSAVFLWGQQKSQSTDQTPASNKDFQIIMEVDMVNVPITVRKTEGGFIKGLPQSAFHVYEDGEEQEISTFAQEGVPTRIALVLDISGSVRTEWGTIKYATKKFLEHLAPEDKFALVSFNTDIRLKIDWGRQIDRVDAVLTSIYCKDNTKLWDAIYVVSNDVFKGIKEKKAMIIMSDGLDNDSFNSYEKALQTAIRSEASIYVVSKTQAVREMIRADASLHGIYADVPDNIFVQAELALAKLAYETGGRILYPNSFGQLDDVYAQVDDELRNQYSIGYISNNSVKDGSYRRIRVSVDAPGAQISARPGYYAPDELTHKKNR
jgi:Ca-activated chloride channel homolog